MRTLRIFGVEIDQHPPENEFAVSSIRFPSLTLEFRCRENAAGLTTNLRVAGGLWSKRSRLVAEKRKAAASRVWGFKTLFAVCALDSVATLTTGLLAAIEFLEWTSDNRLRHPKFVALRGNTDATEVTREQR